MSSLTITWPVSFPSWSVTVVKQKQKQNNCVTGIVFFFFFFLLSYTNKDISKENTESTHPCKLRTFWIFFLLPDLKIWQAIAFTPQIACENFTRKKKWLTSFCLAWTEFSNCLAWTEFSNRLAWTEFSNCLAWTEFSKETMWSLILYVICMYVYVRMYVYVVFCKIDHCIHIHWCIVMGLGHNDPWVESHMWPQQTWGQRSSRGQWPLVQVFGKKGQCIHILWCIFKSNILQWMQKNVIAKAGETRGSRTALFILLLVKGTFYMYQVYGDWHYRGRYSLNT